MGVTAILFWILSSLALLSAIMIVVSKNPVHSVLWLILVFFAISGHYLLLNAQFLAIVNIIVYAGAIMVLFLYVLMLIDLKKIVDPQRSLWIKLVGVATGCCLLLVLIAALSKADQTTALTQTIGGNIGLVENLGKILFSEYLVPFEISSILFLSAMVGAVVIGKK